MNDTALASERRWEVKICIISYPNELHLSKMGRMVRASSDLAPQLCEVLATTGANIKLARLRRRLTATAMAQRVGISRKTLARAECGDPAVALGVYARILHAMQLEDSLSGIAAADALGHALQDAALMPKFGRRS